MPVVLNWCDTWSLTIRKERRLSVSENRVLRGIFGPKRDDATRECSKLHNDLYSSPYIIRVIKLRIMRQAGYVARTVERKGVYRVLVGKPHGKSPLGRSRRRWEDNINMDLQNVEWGHGLD